jgi:Sec-independent protein translocase protein TatA
MPSLSLGELTIIAVAVLLFVKPEDLPRFFRTVGRIYGEFRRYVRAGMATMEQVSRLDELPTFDPLPDNVARAGEDEESAPTGPGVGADGPAARFVTAADDEQPTAEQTTAPGSDTADVGQTDSD